MSKKLNIIVGIMLCLILLASVRNYSSLKLGVGPIYYLGGYTLTALGFYAFFKNKLAHSYTYIAPLLYIIWALIGIYRGAFEITSGFIFNQYLHGILSVLVPICIFIFAYPNTVIKSFQIFNIFAILYSFMSVGWNYSHGAYVYAFPPFYYFYLCFINKIPKIWRYITIIAVITVFAYVGNRSGHAKIVMSFGVFCIFILPNILQKIVLNIIFWFLYLIPIILLYLGLSGQYNVFKNGGSAKSNDKIVVTSCEIKKSNETSIDTRTFLYEEVLASMYINDCIISGRTPARGYYSPAFAKDADPSIKGISPYERGSCEVAHLNTLNWLGIIGLLLITLVYFQGSYLALYRSKNIYVKCLSLEIAFMWLWSWIENYNIFNIFDVMIYVMLAICYSPYFREMKNIEFEMFFKSIFRWPMKDLNDYNKYQITNALLLKKSKQ